MTEQDKLLYRTASSGMLKKAGASDFLSGLNLSDGAKAALIGTLAGGGVGAVSHMLTPKDEDEDGGKRLLRNVLFGAAMGGLAGYGGKTIYDQVKPAPSKPEPWVERHLDPDVSTVLGGTSAVTGGVAAKKLYNNILAGTAGENVSPLVSGGRFVQQPGLDAKVDPSIRKAYEAYAEASSSPLRRTKAFLDGITNGRLFKGEAAAQAARDTELMRALHNARATGSGVGGSFREALFKELAERGIKASPKAKEADLVRLLEKSRGLKSFFRNPRRIIDASRHTKGGRRALAASAATALAALVVKQLGKDPR